MTRSILLAALLALAITACGKKEEAPVEATPAVEAAPAAPMEAAPAAPAEAAPAAAPEAAPAAPAAPEAAK